LLLAVCHQYIHCTMQYSSNIYIYKNTVMIDDIDLSAGIRPVPKSRQMASRVQISAVLYWLGIIEF